jgi:hypothetical protein
MMKVVKNLSLYIVLAVVVPFLILESAFRLLPVAHPPYLLPVSTENPVARFQPNVEYRYSSGWNFAIQSRKRSNNFGYNNISDYHPEKTTPLLMVIGDSFVEAHQVHAGKSAAEILNLRLAGKGRVYSMGLSGSPLSQYLAFAEYSRNTFRPHAMAFVIILNDFDESLLKYKSEPRLHYFDESGRLRRVDYELSTAKQILRHSAFIRYAMLNLLVKRRIEQIRGSFSRSAGAETYLDRTPDPMQRRIPDSKKAVDYFLDQLPEKSGLDSKRVVFVLDAVRPAMYSPDTLAQAESGYHAQMRRYFEAQARARGYEVVDMQPVFISRHRRDNSRFEFPTDSHWNELANSFAAEEIQNSATFGRIFAGDLPSP